MAQILTCLRILMLLIFNALIQMENYMTFDVLFFNQNMKFNIFYIRLLIYYLFI